MKWSPRSLIELHKDAYQFVSDRYWRIRLQKSKIKRHGKSRESRFLDISTAAKLCRADTKVRGHFCVKRCGPSRRRMRNASAVLKIFVRQPKKTFSTLSAQSGRSYANSISRR